jgi:methylthioribose-1-phosphate isomerase
VTDPGERKLMQPVKTVDWHDGVLIMLDQRRLPLEVTYLVCETVDDVAQAIQTLAVRGAPAIGVAAAFGVALAARQAADLPGSAFRSSVTAAIERLRHTRPTAVNLFWALERMRAVLDRHFESVAAAKNALVSEAQGIMREDEVACSRMGRFGAELIQDGWTILTHCNAGALATAGSGTALAVIYEAHARGKRVEVLADETRPLLQGARLTAWELGNAGVPVSLICDDMAAWAMRAGMVDCVVTGADRIAANGDTANKIGTYGLAVLAKYHALPFLVVAPFSTVDTSLSTGAQIPIEERSTDEVTEIQGRRIAPRGVKVRNPAFDVTPSELITAIVTDKGVAYPPYGRSLHELAEGRGSRGAGGRNGNDE